MEQPEWKGATSKRFSAGKIHLRPQEELHNVGIPINYHEQHQGIRTYPYKLPKEMEFKPCVKIISEAQQHRSKDIDLRGKRPLKLAEQPERFRLEKSHISGGLESSEEQAWRGIKTFSEANKTNKKEYVVESKMQSKIRILGLDDQRNHLGVYSMGDKPYKYPEYCPQFYQHRGLIAGSTQTLSKANAHPNTHQIKNVLTKPNWDLVVKMEEEAEEKRVLNSVDEWEQTVLKEANPKWKDPDTFFDEVEPPKQPNKDSKKTAKK